MTLVTIYQANNPETLPVMITEPELVLESELPDRLEELNDKTQNINADGTTLSNITTINERKIGVPHAWNFVYWDYAPFIPVCNAYSGSMTIGHTLIFKDEYGADYAGAILSCNARGQLEIMGRFSADMYKTDVGFALRQYKSSTMKFMKYDDTTSMLTLNSLDDTATFLGNVVAPNITSLETKTQAITYEAEGDKTIIANTTETGNLKVTYDIDTYTLTVGSHATFSGSVFFSATINGYNIENELSKLQYMSTMDDITEVSGPFRASNLVGITYDDNLNTTFFSGNLSSPNISTLEDNLANLIGIIGGVTGFSGNLQADDFVTTSGTLNTVINNTQNITRVPGTPEGDPSYTEIDGVSFQTTLGRISNIEFTLSNVSYDPITPCTTIAGNLVTGTLNGNNVGTPTTFLYSNYSPFIPVCDTTGVIEIGRHMDFHNIVDSVDYLARLSCVGTSILEIAGTSSMRMTRIDTSVGMALRTGFTSMNFYKNDASTSMLTLDATTDVATFLGNIVAPSLNGNKIGASDEGFGYTTDAPYIPVCKANGITELGNRIDFHLADAVFRDFSAYISNTALNTLRIYGTTADSGTLETNALHFRTSGDAVRLRMITNGYQNICVYNTAGTFTWVMDSDGTNGLERWSTTRINAINASTRTTAITYTPPVVDPPAAAITTIAGDLTVTGSIHGTLAGSQTITHKTKYTGTITPGCFVESTGQIYREPPKVGTTSIWNEPIEEGQQGYYTEIETQSALSPYENCISIVKQAEGFSSNIIGVCTEVIDHEFCKFATHGDCLIKCVSDTYHLGDIIIPSSSGGYGKKGSSMEIIDCMTKMVPRLKITSLETDEIDPECVVGFISI